MRVLFTCVPGYGHFHPMVPLARALEGAGHEVAFATAERFCRRVVESAGFRAFPAGLSPLVVHERTAEVLGLGVGDEGLAAEDAVWRFGAQMFAGVAAPAKVPDLLGILDDWGGDVVVHDMTDFAGPVAAARRGLGWAALSFGALQPGEFWDRAAELAAPLWAEGGVEPDARAGMFRHLYLDTCPSSLQSPAIGDVATARPLRPVTFDNPEGTALPARVAELGPGPLVYVTLGTVVNHAPGVLEAVVEGLGSGPWPVVLTVGPDRDPAELAGPANVHVERYLPQSLLLERCALVACHAGSGTVLAALSRGLPLVLLPQDANQFANADRVAEVGAGLVLRPTEVDAPAVRRAVEGALADPGLARAAARVAAEIAAMPGPEEVVGLVEALGRGPAAVSGARTSS